MHTCTTFSLRASGDVHLMGSLAVSWVDDASLVKPKSLTLAMLSSETKTFLAARSLWTKLLASRYSMASHTSLRRQSERKHLNQITVIIKMITVKRNYMGVDFIHIPFKCLVKSRWLNNTRHLVTFFPPVFSVWSRSYLQHVCDYHSQENSPVILFTPSIFLFKRTQFS